VSEIDNGWTLRIPLGPKGTSTFVTESLFEGAEKVSTFGESPTSLSGEAPALAPVP
jgi:hypothetical protein